jgi:hypothetical protein
MTSTRSARFIPLMLAGMLTAGRAQQAQPGQQVQQVQQIQQGPVIGLPVPPLGAGPSRFQAAEQQQIRVSVSPEACRIRGVSCGFRTAAC